MPISNASIPVGATLAPSGGTATNLVVVGRSLSDAATFVGTTGVTQLTRTAIDFSVKQPKVNAGSPGGFTQGRSIVKITSPKVLANLKRTLNSIKIELSFDPETTDAEVTALKTQAALLLVDSDFTDFWLNQSTN